MKRRTLLQVSAGTMFMATQTGKVRAAAPAKDRRQELYALLGKLPPRARRVSGQLVSTEDRGTYTLEKLVLDLNGEEPAPAWFARPKGSTGKLPTVLFNHSHGGGYQIGKTEFIEGREYLGKPPYAEFLTSLGYNALCIDAWIFGERSGRAELDMFKDMIWHGRVLWGMMVYDSLKAVDYLVTRPDVDVNRLATVGMSMGSSSAQWLGALDPRIKVVVDICCLTDWHTLVEVGGLKGHGIYYYVPDLLSHFSTAQMNMLIAPRPHLSLAGNQDPLTPLPGLEKVDRELKDVYAAAGKPHNWKLLRYDVGHQETPEMREEIRKWFVAHL
ncbi:MAG TPA: acetylxylan esterase [Steroidobacteraceae bacterium]|nr:acetylxylan esterase [Steroidobacteraceae bacterium]